MAVIIIIIIIMTITITIIITIIIIMTNICYYVMLFLSQIIGRTCSHAKNKNDTIDQIETQNVTLLISLLSNISSQPKSTCHPWTLFHVNTTNII